MTIHYFRNSYEFLSVSYPVPIKFNDIVFPTLVHAFEASKTLDTKLKKRIANLPVNEVQSFAAAHITPEKDWEKMKIDLVRFLNKIKFGIIHSEDDNPSVYMRLAMRLLSTKADYLAFGNTDCATFWGVCECPKHIPATGKNMLGNILMDVRGDVLSSARKYMHGQDCQCDTRGIGRVFYADEWDIKCIVFCGRCQYAAMREAEDISGSNTFVTLWDSLPSEHATPIISSTKAMVPVSGVQIHTPSTRLSNVKDVGEKILQFKDGKWI